MSLPDQARVGGPTSIAWITTTERLRAGTGLESASVSMNIGSLVRSCLNEMASRDRKHSNGVKRRGGSREPGKRPEHSAGQVPDNGQRWPGYGASHRQSPREPPARAYPSPPIVGGFGDSP